MDDDESVPVVVMGATAWSPWGAWGGTDPCTEVEHGQVNSSRARSLELLAEARSAWERNEERDAMRLVDESLACCDTEEGRALKQFYERFGPNSDAAKAVRRVLTPGYTHYRVMGIAQHATTAQVKKAYKSLSLAVHPDRNHASNAEQAFKRLGQAFTVLSNKVSRAAYDARLRGSPSSHRAGASWKNSQHSHRQSSHSQHSARPSHSPPPAAAPAAAQPSAPQSTADVLRREISSLRAELERRRANEAQLRRDATMGQRSAQMANDMLKAVRQRQADVEAERRKVSEDLKAAMETNSILQAELHAERQAKLSAQADSEAMIATVRAMVAGLHKKADRGSVVASRGKKGGDSSSIREELMLLARALTTDVLTRESNVREWAERCHHGTTSFRPKVRQVC